MSLRTLIICAVVGYFVAKHYTPEKQVGGVISSAIFGWPAVWVWYHLVYRKAWPRSAATFTVGAALLMFWVTVFVVAAIVSDPQTSPIIYS